LPPRNATAPVVGALGLLAPRLAGLAALGLAGLLVGATATNLFVIGESPWLPIALLLVSVPVAWGRRSRTRELAGSLGR
jgi:putative oxidoreductase